MKLHERRAGRRTLWESIPRRREANDFAARMAVATGRGITEGGTRRLSQALTGPPEWDVTVSAAPDPLLAKIDALRGEVAKAHAALDGMVKP